MSVRQYVGARYVPKIFEFNGSSDWVAGIAYEALTIVTYAGSSFTSKKPVPAGVGQPNLNPEYWVHTANYNAQVGAIQSEVNALNVWRGTVDNKVEDLVRNDRKHVVLIGDSYSDNNYLGGRLWCDIVCDNLGLTLHNYSTGGDGFINTGDTGGTFLTQANSSVADSSFTSDEVRYVFVYGGLNDLTGATPISSLDELGGQIYTLFNYLRDSYPKSEIIYLGCDTWVDGLSSKNGLYNQVDICRRVAYMDYVTSLRLTYAWFGLTGFFGANSHPNQAGHNYFGGLVLKALRGQYVDVRYVSSGISFNGEGWQNVASDFGTSGTFLWVGDNGIDLVFGGRFECDANASNIGTITINIPNNITSTFVSFPTLYPVFYNSGSETREVFLETLDNGNIVRLFVGVNLPDVRGKYIDVRFKIHIADRI